METKEVVLPSGAFARIRNVLWRDRLIASGAAQGNTDMFFVHLVTRVVTIDEKDVTAEQALNLDVREADALINALVPLLSGPIKAPNGSTVLPPILRKPDA